ncbi:MAG: sporulation protein [Bacteroidota bacterium]|nr:sporulation protein [Bacteroidota bacterium]
MGFFGKIKQVLGIGTVSVKISATPTFSTSDVEIKGAVVITGKSDQLIESVKIEFEETFTTGSGDKATTKKFELGSVKLNGFAINKGETKNVVFTLPFSYSKTASERLADKGGVMGGIGKVSGFMQGEKSKFTLIATVDVKGASFDPNDVVELKKAK